MRPLLAFPLAALLAAAACTRADILRLDPTPRPQTTASAIHLIGQEPTQPYKVIAIVSARTLGSIDDARHRLVTEAARLGGHAVLLDNGSLTRLGKDANEQQITGKVIVYTDSTRSN